LSKDEFRRAKELVAWKERIRRGWGELRILEVKNDVCDNCQVGDPLHVRARLRLGQLTPDDISVELVSGPLDAAGEIVQSRYIPMIPDAAAQGDAHEFAGTIEPATSGRHGYTVRVLPKNPDLVSPQKEGLILWS
jgi:starch phosphorylase